GYRVAIAWQAIEIGAMKARECFQPIERTCRLEGLGIELERSVGRVAARTSARVLLGPLGVRCRIGAEKESRIATRRRPQQGTTMLLALENRHAIKMGPYATDEQRVARPEQMLRRDGCADVAGSRCYKLHGFGRCHVLEHDPQAGEIAHDPG